MNITPLYLAVELMNIDIIKLLLEHEKINVNAQNILNFNILITLLRGMHFNDVSIQ